MPVPLSGKGIRVAKGLGVHVGSPEKQWTWVPQSGPLLLSGKGIRVAKGIRVHVGSAEKQWTWVPQSAPLDRVGRGASPFTQVSALTRDK